MISLDQVQKLETKVNNAVDLIKRMKAEKNILVNQMEEYQLRISELEEMTEKLSKDQNEIEYKIIGALNQLEVLEAEEISYVHTEEISTKNEEESAVAEETLEISESSAKGSVSEENVIVEAKSLDFSEVVVNDELEEEIVSATDDEEEILEVVEPIVEPEVTIHVSEVDNQSELQEDFTEDSQVRLAGGETPSLETETAPVVEEVKEEEDEKPKNESLTDLFEQSLDIF